MVILRFVVEKRADRSFNIFSVDCQTIALASFLYGQTFKGSFLGREEESAGNDRDQDPAERLGVKLDKGGKRL